MAFQTRTDLQNQAIGWLRMGCRSLGGGTVVRFPIIWGLSGKCRFKYYMRVETSDIDFQKPPEVAPVSERDCKTILEFREGKYG